MGTEIDYSIPLKEGDILIFNECDRRLICRRTGTDLLYAHTLDSQGNKRPGADFNWPVLDYADRELASDTRIIRHKVIYLGGE